MSCLLLRSSKNAFIMQSKSTFLEFFNVYPSLQICPLPPPLKILQGRNLLRMNDVISIEHMLCSQESSFTICLASWCASLSSLTFSLRLVCFLVEFWTVLPCLFMFTNTIAYAFRCYTWKQLYLIAVVDLVPVATEKVSLIRSNTVWNRWKSTLRTRSIRVNLNHGTEM